MTAQTTERVPTALPDGSAYTTAEFSVNFVRAVTLDTGPLCCEATVLHAHGSTTCVVFPIGGSG